MNIGFIGGQALAISVCRAAGAAAARRLAPVRARCSLIALLPALILIAAPAIARGDIYKWTDEQGRTNLSNVLPATPGKAKDIELVLKETKPAVIPQHLATPTEQALLSRIENLERELQSRRYSTQAPGTPPPADYRIASTPSPPPPSPAYYDSGYDGSYISSYPIYQYPVARSYAYVVYPTRVFVSRPAFVVRHSGGSHFSRGGGGHRGRR